MKRKLNYLAILVYIGVVIISTIVGIWLIKVLYFMYLFFKTLINL